MKNGLIQRLLQYSETIFFVVSACANVSLIWAWPYFPSLDGAAHIYNANLILELLSGDAATISQFFQLNAQPVPNWMGHAILVLCRLFFDASQAQQILLSIYAIGLPLTFRYLILSGKQGNRLVSYFIFPFVYSFIFILGFYNFCLGLVLFFWTVGFWKRRSEMGISAELVIKLFLLLTATYFSHLFMFGVTLAVLGLELITNFVTGYTKESTWNFRATGQKLLILGMAALLPLALTVLYLLNHQVGGSSESLPALELKEWVKNFRPVISIHQKIEEAYSTKLFYIFLILLAVAIYRRIHGLESDLLKGRWKALRTQLLDRNDVFLLSAGLLFIAYLIVPNSTGHAGFFSVRLLQLGFLMAIVWIAKQKQSYLVAALFMAFVLYINFKLFLFYKSELYSQQAVINNIRKAASSVEPGSTVLPINLSYNWLDAHYSNYLGAEKPVVILENYEAGTGYFPIKWNDTIPRVHLGDAQFMDHCRPLPPQAIGTSSMADYVFLLGNDSSSFTDSCKARLDTLLRIHYRPVFDEGNVRLYKNASQDI